MNTFLKSNKTQWRLLRTIFQGVLSVLIANVDLLIGGFEIPMEYKAMGSTRTGRSAQNGLLRQRAARACLTEGFI